MEQRWSMRVCSEGDEWGILELWRAVYPEREYDQERFLRWWRWMYKDNSAGTGQIWLTEHDGQIVGQYAIIPVVMKIGDETALGSRSIDTMTHPDYRRRRIFETLAKQVYDEARRQSNRFSTFRRIALAMEDA